MAKFTENEALNFCLDWIARIAKDIPARNQDMSDAYDYYFAKSLGDEIDGLSKVVTSDLADTIEWLMPSIMDIFSSAEDVVRIEPVGEEDEKPAQLLNKKVNHDLTRRNKWFLIIHDWVKDSLLLRNGIVKCWWHTDVRKHRKYYHNLTDLELRNLTFNPGYELIEDKFEYDESEETDVRRTIFEITTKERYPKYIVVPIEDVGYPNDTVNLRDAKFIYHRFRMKEYEIREEYGNAVMDKLVGAKEGKYSPEALNVIQDRFQDITGINFIYDEDADEYIGYECYFKDSEGTPKVCKIMGAEVLEYEDNQYERPIFFTHSPIRLPHRVIGRSLFDLVKDIQEIRTAIVRGMLNNIYFNNAGRWRIDEDRANIADLMDNNVPGGIVRGMEGSIESITPPPLQPWVFQALEYVETMEEMKTGRARFQQGVVKGSLHRTFRGQAQIVSAFQQRVVFMAKILAEGLAELVDFVVNLNLKFLDRKTSIRLGNEWHEIDPDNLGCRYDIEVNVGVGSQSREEIVSQMQQLLQLGFEMLSVGIPCVSPENFYNMTKTLLECMGRKNTSLYVTNPARQEQVSAIIQSGMQGVQEQNRDAILQAFQMLGQILGVAPPGEGKGQPGKQPTQPDQPYRTYGETDKGYGGAFEGQEV